MAANYFNDRNFTKTNQLFSSSKKTKVNRPNISVNQPIEQVSSR